MNKNKPNEAHFFSMLFLSLIGLRQISLRHEFKIFDANIVVVLLFYSSVCPNWDCLDFDAAAAAFHEVLL